MENISFFNQIFTKILLLFSEGLGKTGKGYPLFQK